MLGAQRRGLPEGQRHRDSVAPASGGWGRRSGAAAGLASLCKVRTSTGPWRAVSKTGAASLAGRVSARSRSPPQQNPLPRLYAASQTPTGDGQRWRNAGCFCFSQCLPRRAQAAREASAERSKADLCHGSFRRPRASVASQVAPSNTGTAFLMGGDVDISPRQRCFGRGNRKTGKQMGSAATTPPCCRFTGSRGGSKGGAARAAGTP